MQPHEKRIELVLEPYCTAWLSYRVVSRRMNGDTALHPLTQREAEAAQRNHAAECHLVKKKVFLSD